MIAREQVLLSWSGGKDCSLALASLRADDRFVVVGLLTSITSGYGRVSIHGVRRTLVETQAEQVDLPLFEIDLAPQSSNDAYEAAFLAAVARVRAVHPLLRYLAFGDLYLADVRAYRERLVRAAGLEPLFPLWGRDTGQLASEFIAAGFRATLVCVDTTQLAAAFAGRAFDTALLEALPPGVDPCGEGGEFHTFVSAGPIFREPIAIDVGEIVLRDGRFAYCDILPAGVGSPRPGTAMSPTVANGKICYLEIPALDIPRSIAFYETVFGWRTRQRSNGTMAFDDAVGEVSGSWVLRRPPSETPGVLVYMMVDSAADTIELIEAQGGEIVQPIGADAPEITARFRDPAGNVFGIYQQPA